MPNFEILENGNKVATIAALTAKSALRKAAKEYPRRACDYNMSPDDATITVEWFAVDTSGRSNRASAQISVPGVGLKGCSF
jgi:hypothetical protein